MTENGAEKSLYFEFEIEPSPPPLKSLPIDTVAATEC
jgi:hypothetical protein